MQRPSAFVLIAAAPLGLLACSQRVAGAGQTDGQTTGTPAASAQVAMAQPLVTTRGLDAAAMRAAVARARALPRLRALIVARDGRTLAEHRFAGPSLDTPVNIKSASKWVLSALAGIAIGRGVLTGVDQKIAPVLRVDLPARPDPRLSDIDVSDLLRADRGSDTRRRPRKARAAPSTRRSRSAVPFGDAGR